LNLEPASRAAGKPTARLPKTAAYRFLPGFFFARFFLAGRGGAARSTLGLGIKSPPSS
jgi:hypothetical protein